MYFFKKHKTIIHAVGNGLTLKLLQMVQKKQIENFQVLRWTDLK